MDEKKLVGWDKWKRKIAIFKFTLGRGYLFCQLPALSLIGAGVLAPYFPGLGLWFLAIIAFLVFMIVGWLDVKFHILHEEQKYMTEMNPILMKGLFGDKNSKVTSSVNARNEVSAQDVTLAQEIIDELDKENNNE